MVAHPTHTPDGGLTSVAGIYSSIANVLLANRPGERGSHQSHCDGAPDSGGPPNLTLILILTLTLTLKKGEKGK